MSNIRELLEQAEVAIDTCVILEDAEEEDIPDLAPMLPKFLKHRSWLVRSSAVEIVGGYGLSQHIDIIETMFEDKNFVVRTSALCTYFDLRGNRALPRILEYCTHKTSRMRLVALCLVYVITRDVKVLIRIKEIATRNQNGYFYNQGIMFGTFEEYLETENYPEIIELYKKVLEIIPKQRGVAKDYKSRLKELGL